jgi:hypothetical protein
VSKDVVTSLLTVDVTCGRKLKLREHPKFCKEPEGQRIVERSKPKGRVEGHIKMDLRKCVELPATFK